MDTDKQNGDQSSNEDTTEDQNATLIQENINYAEEIEGNKSGQNSVVSDMILIHTNENEFDLPVKAVKKMGTKNKACGCKAKFS